MERLTRQPQKVFAIDAANNGQFGSGALGTKVLSDNIVTLQALDAYEEGWLEAVIGTKKFPPIEEFQSLNYINTYQLAYLFQEGLAEWNTATTYYQNSIVRKSGTYELYGSLIDNNIGNALPNAVDDANWQFLIDLSINAKIPYGITTGTPNNYDVDTDPVFDTLVDGAVFVAQIDEANTGATTLNPNSIGDLPVFSTGAACVGGELLPGVDYFFAVDEVNTRLILMNPSYLPLPTASTTAKGIIEIATAVEVENASDVTKAVTPGTMVNHPGVAKAWGLVTCVGITYTVAAEYNIDTVARQALGEIWVNLDVPFESTDYVVVCSGYGAGVVVGAVPLTADRFLISIRRNSGDGPSIDDGFHFTCYGPQ